MGDNNDCAVIALAIALDRPYREMHELLAKHGRQFRDGTYRATQERALESLGWSRELVSPESIQERFPEKYRHQGVTTYSPRRFPGSFDHLGPGPFLFYTATHVCTFKDGIVHDWTAEKSLRVLAIWRLVRIQNG